MSGNESLQSRLEYVRLYSELQASLLASEDDTSAALDAATIASQLLSASGGLPDRHWGKIKKQNNPRRPKAEELVPVMVLCLPHMSSVMFFPSFVTYAQLSSLTTAHRTFFPLLMHH